MATHSEWPAGSVLNLWLEQRATHGIKVHAGRRCIALCTPRLCQHVRSWLRNGIHRLHTTYSPFSYAIDGQKQHPLALHPCAGLCNKATQPRSLHHTLLIKKCGNKAARSLDVLPDHTVHSGLQMHHMRLICVLVIESVLVKLRGTKNLHPSASSKTSALKACNCEERTRVAGLLLSSCRMRSISCFTPGCERLVVEHVDILHLRPVHLMAVWTHQSGRALLGSLQAHAQHLVFSHH